MDDLAAHRLHNGPPSLGNLGTSIRHYPSSDTIAREGDSELKLLNGLVLKVQTQFSSLNSSVLFSLEVSADTDRSDFS